MAPRHFVVPWIKWSLWKYRFSKLFWLRSLRPKQPMSFCVNKFLVDLSMTQLIIFELFAIFFSGYQSKLCWLGRHEILLTRDYRPIIFNVLFCAFIFLFDLRLINFLKIIFSQFLFTWQGQLFELVFSQGPFNHTPHELYRWRGIDKVTAMNSRPKIVW